MKSSLSFLTTLCFLLTLFACQSPENQDTQLTVDCEEFIDTLIYTSYSHLSNQYSDFSSPKAINLIAKIENEYFRNYDLNGSQYYGTLWREEAETIIHPSDSGNLFLDFREDLGIHGDSMHCTIYAVKSLQAGMGDDFEKLEQSHRRIWNTREHAGWSIGYLLVKEWNWKAYLIIDRDSEEFSHCLKSYQRKKEYPVWRQPNIPLETMLIRGEDDEEISKLLAANEFGWGFSHQGIHTWITRFDTLKECNWTGSPAKKYEFTSLPLFLKTSFLDYYAYASHVVIFPPKRISKIAEY